MKVRGWGNEPEGYLLDRQGELAYTFHPAVEGELSVPWHQDLTAELARNLGPYTNELLQRDVLVRQCEFHF